MPPTVIQNKKIHLAINQISLPDDVYRDILYLNFKVESSKNLTPFQADQLLEIFKAKGFKPKQSSKSKLSPKYDERTQRKVVAMWITMHKAGAIRNGNDRALQAYVKRVTGIDNLKWCGGSECHVLIESLKSWAERENIDVENY